MAISNLQDKIVVITGAGSGIGRATALAFAREGAHIVASDIKRELLDELRFDIKALGSACATYSVDVSDQSAMQAFAEKVKSEVGVPHVLINNAGIGYIGKFLESDLAHWQRVLNINVMGVVHGCYYFLPMMLAAGDARAVLNVSSSSGNFPSPSMAAYGASKGAVSTFTETLKMELVDSKVHIATICPGVTNTPIVRGNINVGDKVSDETLEKLRHYYETKGCSPGVIAADMVNAVKTDKDIVLSGPGTALVYHTRRVSMKLLRLVMINFSRKSGYL